MNLQLYHFSFGFHREKKVIWIRFQKDYNLIKQLRTRFPSVKFSRTNLAWYLPDLPSVRTVLQLEEKEFGTELKLHISPNNQKALVSFVNQLKLKAYSVNTIRTYVSEFAHLLKTIKNYSVDDLTEQRLKDYF